MKKEHIFLVFILLLTFFSFYHLFQILSPFLSSISWAILLAMMFYPVYQRLHRWMKKKAVLSAMAVTCLIVIVMVLPFSFLTISLANEVIDAYHRLQEMIQTGRLEVYLEQVKELPILRGIAEGLNRYFDLSQMDPGSLLLKNLQQVSTFLFNQTSKILKGLSTFVIGFFFTLLSLYYLFKDGERLFGSLKEILPVPPKERDLLIRRFKDMVYATLYGGILVALVQGILGGLIFLILGISSPVLWGTAMAFLSFIPIGGTALVWAPAAIVLMVEGTLLKGFILLFVGIFGISMVDNFLRPFFISAKTNIHPLLLFFTVLGGIDAFGLIGLVAGPLVATLCLTLVEIYIEGIRYQGTPGAKSHP